MKLSKKQLRKIINEAMYKGVPAEFADDHKQQMGARMRDNSEFMELLRQNQMGFGEKGIKYEPEIGPDGRPIGVSQRDRTELEMEPVHAMRRADEEERQAQRARDMEKVNKHKANMARLESIPMQTLRSNRDTVLDGLEKISSDTSYPYGRARGDVKSVTTYRKLDGSTFTPEELQAFQDYDLKSSMEAGPYAALAGTTSTSLSPDNITLTIKYNKYTSG